MHEESEPKRYYLELERAGIASLCILFNKDELSLPELPDFTVIIGIKDIAAEAAWKSVEIEDLMRPAQAVRHGAGLNNGRAVITLSYPCTSPQNHRCPSSARLMPVAFILGLLAAEGYMPMEDYYRAMRHYHAMEKNFLDYPLDKTAPALGVSAH